jgi:hypothetical protein
MNYHRLRLPCILILIICTLLLVADTLGVALPSWQVKVSVLLGEISFVTLAFADYMVSRKKDSEDRARLKRISDLDQG